MLSNPDLTTVLVVEDDRVVRDLIVVALAGLCPELDVITAEDGLQALHMIRERRPKLVLLDILLPRLNGLDVMRQLKTLVDEPIPVIVISALALRDVVAQAIEAGARDFVVKPFDPHLLAEKIMCALSLQASAAESPSALAVTA